MCVVVNSLYTVRTDCEQTCEELTHLVTIILQCAVIFLVIPNPTVTYINNAAQKSSSKAPATSVPVLF